MSKNKKTKNKPKQTKGIILAIILIIIISTYTINKLGKEPSSFKFMELEWKQGVYDGEEIFHTKFPVGENGKEVYLKIDPRANYQDSNITIGRVKSKVYVSTSKEVNDCILNTPKIKDDLKNFLEDVMGKEVIFKTTDAEWALETDNVDSYKTCTNSYKESVIVLEIGEDNLFVHPYNNLCYVVQMENCKDTSSIEKLMLELMLNK